MRSDMAKVIVERPRIGHRLDEKKGYRKSWQRRDPESWPQRESIFARGGHEKWFNEHLAPLRRYLQKQVGRPWNKVFAEICENLSLDSVIQSHVRDHVNDYVATDVIEESGRLYHGFNSFQFSGRPLDESRFALLYVCPRTGILRLVKQRKHQPVVKRICESETRQFHRLNDAWFEVRLRTLPQDSDGCWDAVLEKPVGRCRLDELKTCYGFVAYALSKRPLKPDETRALLKRLKNSRK